LEEYINQQIQINLGAWQQQADNAITDARSPADEESSFYFFVALAGNLVWAATCFIPVAGEVTTLVKVMSIGGAVLGSGAVQQGAKWARGRAPTTPDEAKLVVRKAPAEARGNLEQHLKSFRRKWAAELDGLAGWERSGLHPDRIVDMFDQYVWEAMYPKFPFGVDRFELIRSSLLQVMNDMLADFNRQWQQFKQHAAWYGDAERAKWNIYFRPVLKVYWEGVLVSGGAYDIRYPGAPEMLDTYFR